MSRLGYQYGTTPVQQGLPAGWEAKYDPTNRKWFYINHATKTTQWDDPRMTMQQQPTSTSRYGSSPQPRQTTQPLQKKTAATTSFIEAEPNKAKDIVENFGVDPELVNSLLRTHMNNVAGVESALKDMGFRKKPEAKAHFVKMLKDQYRSAPVSVIKTQLINTNNSVQGARLGLEALGYKREVIDGSAVVKPSPTGYRAPKQNAQASKPNATKQKESKPAKPKVDAATAKRQLKQKFPNLDDTTITLCLKVAQNDVEMAAKILEAKEDKDRTSSAARKVEEKSEEVEAPRQYAPQVFGADQPSSSSAPIPTINIPTFSLTIPDLFASADPEPTQNTTPDVRQKKRYTAVKKFEKRAPQRKPAATVHTSSLRIEPMGPNPDLCKGPDPSLLLKTYAQRMGPNRANRKGPMKTNRCGPNLSIRVGPRGLAVGPARFSAEV